MSRRALIAEPSPAISGALARFLEPERFAVEVVRYVDEAVHRIREAPPDLLLATVSTSFDGEALCAKAKQLAPALPVLLLYAPEEDEPAQRADKVGADGALSGPLKRGTVVPMVRVLLQLAELRQQLERQSAKAPAAPAEPERGASDLEFLKKYMVMEVKRSRRYRYPLSLLLIEPDRFGERTAALSEPEHRAALSEVLAAVAQGLRDIDVAVPYPENRFLVLLPHTAREGALVVATRIQERLARTSSLPSLTASVGLASVEPSEARAQVSFASLVKWANEGLLQAQQAGGDRVIAHGERPRRSRISLG